MATKGEAKSQKAISTAKIRFFPRKEHVWAIRNSSGPHSGSSAVPLGFILRDMLHVASTKKEAKMVLSSGGIKVNGIARAQMKFPVGLFDVIEFSDTKKLYRLVLDSKGRAALAEMDGKAAAEKVSKILKKIVVKNGEVEVTTSDGFVLKQGKHPLKVADSVKLSLPDKKIVGHFSLESGKFALIIGGTHAGEVVKIKEIIAGSMHKPRVVKTEGRHGEISTLEKYICVVGDKKGAEQMNLEVFEK